MNRRGFLKFLPAAAVGGKRALVEAAERLVLPGVVNPGLAGSGGGAPAPDGSPLDDDPSRRIWATKRLFQLANPVHLEQRRQDAWHVHALDPDLASMYSMSLSAKIVIQRERNYQRALDADRGFYGRVLSGLWDEA